MPAGSPAVPRRRPRHSRLAAALLAVLPLVPLASTALAQGPPVDYDIVYVRQPRYGDDVNTIWPEVWHPARLEPGADLVLLHPDGSEEVLVRGGNGGVTDPFVSFDGEWVYYSFFYDLRRSELNPQRGLLPLRGADIFRLHLPSRRIEQLTHGEFTPNTGAGSWDESNPVDPPSELNRLGYGVLNLGPCPLPGGRVAFTSNRNGFLPPKRSTNPTLQLFVMDEDGGNVTPIAPMTISSALHPTIRQDGKILFSSHEVQGVRDRRLWAVWAIQPDGRAWEPVASAFRGESAFHFMTQMGNGDIVFVDYYNLNNNGFGALYRIPADRPPGTPAFHSAFPEENPDIWRTDPAGRFGSFRMSFTPRGMYSISLFTHERDSAAPIGRDGQTRVGKFTHPSAAPGDDLLVVWTPGPANDLRRPTSLPYYDSGLYLIAGGDPVNDPAELILIKNDPRYNEAWPRAVVPYRAIHGIDEPVELPWLPNDGSLHPELPAGTPFGLVGTSSFYKRESFPGVGSSAYGGLDRFNTSQNQADSNWLWQGADAGRYDDSDIWAVRIVGMEPNTHRSYGPHDGNHHRNHAGNERLRILGEIPLRKVDSGGNPVLDPEGNPDTSFVVKIPADTPFTFQTLDRNAMVLNMAQTWHQVRPGEVRTDCGGCHAHSQTPLPFESTAAARPDYEIINLARETPLLTRNAQGEPDLIRSQTRLADVEFYRDIRPILRRSCTPCHTGTDPSPPGNLVLDDDTLYQEDGQLIPGDYKRLADDEEAQWGYPPVISAGRWRGTNASRYLRKFQSRRSLLIWKIFGQRLDGWTNADHPTERVPGDPSTLPPGSSANLADLDYTGTMMPPPGSGVPPLSEDEKMTFARWIDLGAPIDVGRGTDDGPYGWFLDDLRPTLTVSLPRPGWNRAPVNEILLGYVDANKGIDPTTVSVQADFPVEGRPAGAELADLLGWRAAGVFSIPLSQPLAPFYEAHLRVEVADRQGNVTRVDRAFSTAENPAGLLFGDSFETGDLSAWSSRVGN